MKNEIFKLQMIAIQALHSKYGFCPAPEQVKLLESDGEGTYILFKVNGHEYRWDDGEIINLEDQKKSEEGINFYFEMFQKARKDKDIAEEKMEALKTECSRLRKALDTDEESLQAMRGAIRDLKEANKYLTDQAEELKKTVHYRELALDKAAAKRDEL